MVRSQLVRRGGRLHMMLRFVMQHDDRIAVVVMDVMRSGAERGHAQRHQQHTCGHA